MTAPPHPAHRGHRRTSAQPVAEGRDFYPLLSIIGYDALEKVANYINAHNRPLTLHALSTDNRRLDGMLDRSISGGVTLNGSKLHAAPQGMASGSIGASGMGDDRSHAGFRRLSHSRFAHRTGFINLLERPGQRWPSAWYVFWQGGAMRDHRAKS